MASKKNAVIISKLYKSRNNLLQLLKKQNYNIDDYSNFSINNLSAMMIDDQNMQLDMLLEKENKKMYAKYHLHNRLRPNYIHEYVDDLFDETLTKKDDLMIIVKDNINDTIVKLLNEFYIKDGIFITIINLKTLQFNILEHSLVPEHIVLSSEEKKQFYKDYNIMNDSQLPEISRYDPVALVIGLRPGEVCKIIRPSPTAITTEYFRLCI